jgi:hypothetical protein
MSEMKLSSIEEIKYDWAEPAVMIAIQSLLKKCDLPDEDISPLVCMLMVFTSQKELSEHIDSY